LGLTLGYKTPYIAPDETNEARHDCRFPALGRNRRTQGRQTKETRFCVRKMGAAQSANQKGGMKTPDEIYDMIQQVHCDVSGIEETTAILFALNEQIAALNSRLDQADAAAQKAFVRDHFAPGI
jgi:hypothetical protein